MLTVKETLDQSPELANLIKQARSKNRLKDELSAILPTTLSKNLRLRDEGSTLTLIAPNSAQAAKLRQLLVSMTDHLQAQGHQFDRIRITVTRPIRQPDRKTDEGADPAPLPTIDRPTLSKRTIEQIAQCSERLADQPKLASILARITKRLRSF